MRWSLSRLAAALLALSLPAAGRAASLSDRAYDARIERYVAGYSALIPKYAKVQFAGSIGLASVGLGWDYGKNGRWETDVLIGVVPRLESNRAKMTFTVRECLVPWDIPIRQSAFQFRPAARLARAQLNHRPRVLAQVAKPLPRRLLFLLHQVPGRLRLWAAGQPQHCRREEAPVAVRGILLRALHQRQVCAERLRQSALGLRRCLSPRFRRQAQNPIVYLRV